MLVDDDFFDKRRFQNFVVFEPFSERISEQDILFRGDEVKIVFDEIFQETAKGQNLKNLILINRLEKIQRMLDLVNDTSGVIITKFVDRIWKRYANLSHLGEVYIDLGTWLTLHPELENQHEDFVAARFDEKNDACFEDALLKIA